MITIISILLTVNHKYNNNNSTTNKDIDRPGYLNSSYNSNRTDITIIEDINKYYITEPNKYE